MAEPFQAILFLVSRRAEGGIRRFRFSVASPWVLGQDGLKEVEDQWRRRGKEETFGNDSIRKSFRVAEWFIEWHRPANGREEPNACGEIHFARVALVFPRGQ